MRAHTPSTLEGIVRRAAACVLALAAAAAVVLGEPGASPRSAHVVARGAVRPAATAVLGVGLTVADLDRNIEFFTGVLGCALLGMDERHGPDVERSTGVFGARTRSADLRLGDELLTLTQFVAPEGRPIPIDSRSNDRWFQHVAIVVSDIDRAYEHLRARGVRHASPAPQTLPESIPAAAGISAFYFKGPEGHVLEIIRFPPGKGDARWQSADGRLFLGIDHTAIVVRDTEAALRFYRDALGLRVAGDSENRGQEQARLNNVEGAHLRITTLRAPRGPGVELLEYLWPRDGRDLPADARPNDALAWITRVAASDAAALMTGLSGWGAMGMSWRDAAGGTAGLPGLLRDPDGHLVRIESDAPAGPQSHQETNNARSDR